MLNVESNREKNDRKEQSREAEKEMRRRELERREQQRKSHKRATEKEQCKRLDLEVEQNAHGLSRGKTVFSFIVPASAHALPARKENSCAKGQNSFSFLECPFLCSPWRENIFAKG